MSTKSFKRKLALLTGRSLKFRKLSPLVSEDYRNVVILNKFRFNKVLDVGANKGQFAQSIIDFGFQGAIVSFEPTSVVYTALQEAAKKFPAWTVAERCAIGNTNGQIDIHISDDPLFNSIKKIRSQFTKDHQNASAHKMENAPIRTLDSFLNIHFNDKERLFLKIDTQGFEKEVLEGASQTLAIVDGIKLEVPLRPIYDNVPWGLTEILSFLEPLGFTCISLSEISVDNNTGIVFEIDAIFIKEQLLNSNI